MIPLVLLIIFIMIIKITHNKLLKFSLLVPLMSILILYVQLILILNMAFSIGALIFTGAIAVTAGILLAPIVEILLNDF